MIKYNWFVGDHELELSEVGAQPILGGGHSHALEGGLVNAVLHQTPKIKITTPI